MVMELLENWSAMELVKIYMKNLKFQISVLADTGPLIQEGMCLAIEPMINMGTHEVLTEKDDWTVSTKDGSLFCSF